MSITKPAQKVPNVPQKVLWYFPSKSRLQRLFINPQVSNDMRWHKDVRVNNDNVATHPADSEDWKHFDREFPLFANDPRNVRLGLATDGFNPFGNLSSSYSIWAVFVVPYNLPPWKCMKDLYMFMSMLIPGPKTPTNIDVYLQPLIDELNDLWGGINAYDAHRKENFTLRAALLWTINDFPAYGMLSGWSVKGYNACPICMNETSSSYLSHSRKVCYMGHRRFLPSSHQWRNDKKNFDGTRETRKPIVPMSGLEVLHDIDCTISEPCCSVKKRKRKNLEGKKGWKKEHILPA
ncbi:leucine-rich repeat protein [Tanacetum coccineum]